MLVQVPDRRPARGLVRPDALEDAAAVVQRVGEHVDLGVVPVHQLAVHPDLVDGRDRHRCLLPGRVSSDRAGTGPAAMLQDSGWQVPDAPPPFGPRPAWVGRRRTNRLTERGGASMSDHEHLEADGPSPNPATPTPWRSWRSRSRIRSGPWAPTSGRRRPRDSRARPWTSVSAREVPDQGVGRRRPDPSTIAEEDAPDDEPELVGDAVDAGSRPSPEEAAMRIRTERPAPPTTRTITWRIEGAQVAKR